MGYALHEYETSMKRLETYRMSPSVASNFVTAHVLFDEDLRTFDSARADDEERRLDLLLVQELK